MDKLIIEVRLNEVARRSSNPHIPYLPDEIAADALACAEAGASIVHFHARTAEGGESNDPEDYARVIGAVRASSDMLIHTTFGQFDSSDPEQRTAHVAKLSADGLKPDIAPLDMGSFNIDFFDPGTRSFAPGGFIYQNRTEDLRAMAGQLKAWGIKPQLVLWSVPNGRLAQAFLDAGLVEAPGFATMLLSDYPIVAGHPVSLKGIEAFVDLCVDARMRWSVLAHGASLLPFVPDIARMGGHVSIGLGDHGYGELGAPTNAEIVRAVADAARASGREVSTPAEARAILGM